MCVHGIVRMFVFLIVRWHHVVSAIHELIIDQINRYSPTVSRNARGHVIALMSVPTCRHSQFLEPLPLT